MPSLIKYAPRATVSLLLGALLIVGATPLVHAQSYLSPKPERHAYEDRFRAEVDVFYGGYDTQIQLNETVTGGNPIPGTVISAEDDLDLPSSQFLGQIEFTLFPGKNYMLRLTGLSMRRDGSTVLQKNISYDNEDYTAGSRVDSYLNLSFVGLTYGYYPWRTDRFELAATFGIHIGSVSARVQARSEPPREPESATGPVPVVGLEGRYDFSRRWSVDARFNYLSAGWFDSLFDLEGTEGTYTDARLALRWRPGQHVAVGLGYRYFELEASSPSSDPSGAVTVGVTGPMLFLQASL